MRTFGGHTGPWFAAYRLRQHNKPFEAGVMFDAGQEAWLFSFGCNKIGALSFGWFYKSACAAHQE